MMAMCCQLMTKSSMQGRELLKYVWKQGSFILDSEMRSKSGLVDGELSRREKEKRLIFFFTLPPQRVTL